MSRATSAPARKARRKKLLSLAKGFRGRAKNNFRIGLEKVEKALQYVYRDRRNRKRDMRSLWIARINAGARLNGITYGRLINGLKLANITLDRKALAELAATEPAVFTSVVEQAKAAIAKAAPAKAA